ncbi:hypothetical protein [Gracilimonas sediminicola]|uniref:hypothetical protein n=1 Tax=Gracilimonas sediminicola TaxID=2952158 RepID=UPI0038D3B4BD
MKITLKQLVIFLVVIIGLIALNVYQWQNPKVVETPSGTAEIDSTAWVQRSAYTSRGVIIDSLEKQNRKLVQDLRDRGDAIAVYANVTGRLRLQKDSLENELASWQEIPKNSLISEIPDSAGVDSLNPGEKSFLEKAREDVREMQGLFDSTFITERQFGNGLFIVTGIVEFRGSQFRQHLKLEQIRDIRLDVVTTVNDDRSRILTYVTSQDFESLEYKSFTQLKPKKKMPWFWIGLATGMAGAALIIN